MFMIKVISVGGIYCCIWYVVDDAVDELLVVDVVPHLFGVDGNVFDETTGGIVVGLSFVY